MNGEKILGMIQPIHPLTVRQGLTATHVREHIHEIMRMGQFEFKWIALALVSRGVIHPKIAVEEVSNHLLLHLIRDVHKEMADGQVGPPPECTYSLADVWYQLMKQGA